MIEVDFIIAKDEIKLAYFKYFDILLRLKSWDSDIINTCFP